MSLFPKKVEYPFKEFFGPCKGQTHETHKKREKLMKNGSVDRYYLK